MFIGRLHISIIHILRIHIIHKQRMQLITLIRLSQHQQRPQRQRQVKLSNRIHLQVLIKEWTLLMSLHLMMPWEVLAWIYEFRPSFFVSAS